MIKKKKKITKIIRSRQKKKIIKLTMKKVNNNERKMEATVFKMAI